MATVLDKIPLNKAVNESKINSVFKDLTTPEKSIVDYHRQMLSSGGAGKNPNGNTVTVYSNTIQIPDGPNKGQYVTVPGWYGGKMVTDENALWKQWQGEIAKGKWPIYADPQEAEKRAQFIHQIMDLETPR